MKQDPTFWELRQGGKRWDTLEERVSSGPQRRSPCTWRWRTRGRGGLARSRRCPWARRTSPCSPSGSQSQEGARRCWGSPASRRRLWSRPGLSSPARRRRGGPTSGCRWRATGGSRGRRAGRRWQGGTPPRRGEGGSREADFGRHLVGHQIRLLSNDPDFMYFVSDLTRGNIENILTIYKVTCSALPILLQRCAWIYLKQYTYLSVLFNIIYMNTDPKKHHFESLKIEYFRLRVRQLQSCRSFGFLQTRRPSGFYLCSQVFVFVFVWSICVCVCISFSSSSSKCITDSCRRGVRADSCCNETDRRT